MRPARPPIRTAIVDDEPLARAAVRAVLEADPEVRVVGECIGVDAPALYYVLRREAEARLRDLAEPSHLLNRLSQRRRLRQVPLSREEFP